MELSQLQYGLATAALTAALTIMAAAAIYFFTQRDQVHRTQQASVYMAVFYTGTAAFHYWRILTAWTNGFVPTANGFKAEGLFVHAYRYSDWMLTVPVLVAQLVWVLRLDKKHQRKLTIQLSGAAALMVLLGLPGELSESNTTKLIWWGAGMVPFAYLVYVLYVGMSGSLKHQPRAIAKTVSNARLLLITSWMVYPVVYLFPMLGLDSATGEVVRQVGYSIADVVAKPAFAFFLLLVARAKGAEEFGFEAASANGSNVPAMPSVPSMPGLPGMPVAPAAARPPVASTPSMPSMPSMPGAPSIPSMPSVPSMPSMPSLPVRPSVPAGVGSPSNFGNVRNDFPEKSDQRMSIVEAAMRDAEFGN
jgi:bacteriorhodopsin